MNSLNLDGCRRVIAMIIDMFRKKKKYSTIQLKNQAKTKNKPVTKNPPRKKVQQSAPKVDASLQTAGVIKCPGCQDVLLDNDVERHGQTCHLCGYHFRIGARQRIEYMVDKGTFKEMDMDLTTADPLAFPEYASKVEKAKERAGEPEGAVSGLARIGGYKTIVAAMDPNFMMGSMGSVVGEKLTRAIEKGIEEDCPVIIFSASGGARMQEGVLSLMQMAKTSAALSRLSESGNLFVSVLTDPTTGGVTASFAMLGDIILAEPGALIAFAGPRVIEQTLRQKLPEGFQKAEFLLKKGFVDRIVKRTDMPKKLAQILALHGLGGEGHE